MSSIVLELQKEVTLQNCDIVYVLRKAHLIAAKLKLSEFDQWISYELNGYPNQNCTPNYRLMRGELKGFDPYTGWIPAIINHAELENLICKRKIQNSISEIITLCEKSNNGFILPFYGSTLQQLNEMFDSEFPIQYALHISSTAVIDIVEKVKNTVLEWTIKLEAEGILGEGMKFNEEEKKNALEIPHMVNNFYGSTNVMNGSAQNMQIVSGNNNEIFFSYEEAKKAIKEIEDSISGDSISIDDKETVLEMLAEISDKIEQKKKPSMIKATLIGLQDFLINVGANVTAGLILGKIQGLF